MKDYYFNQFPIGTYIYSEYHTAIEKVIAHLETTWMGSRRPWYGIATEPVMPKADDENLSIHFQSQRRRKVIAGELPEKYLVHCLNGSGGSGASTVKVDDIQIAVDERDLTVLTWRNGGYLLRHQDRGDPSVGLYGGEVAYSPWNLGITGYPDDITLGALIPCDEDELKDALWRGQPQLVDIVHWILRHKEEERQARFQAKLEESGALVEKALRDLGVLSTISGDES